MPQQQIKISCKNIKNSKPKEISEPIQKDTIPEVFDIQLELKRKILEELYSNEDNLLVGEKESVYESDSEASDDGLSKEDLLKVLPGVLGKKQGNS